MNWLLLISAVELWDSMPVGATLLLLLLPPLRALLAVELSTLVALVVVFPPLLPLLLVLLELLNCPVLLVLLRPPFGTGLRFGLIMYMKP